MKLTHFFTKTVQRVYCAPRRIRTNTDSWDRDQQTSSRMWGIFNWSNENTGKNHLSNHKRVSPTNGLRTLFWEYTSVYCNFNWKTFASSKWRTTFEIDTNFQRNPSSIWKTQGKKKEFFVLFLHNIQELRAFRNDWVPTDAATSKSKSKHAKSRRNLAKNL